MRAALSCPERGRCGFGSLLPIVICSSAVLGCACGGIVAAALIRSGTPTRIVRRADVTIPCPSPCLAESDADDTDAAAA